MAVQKKRASLTRRRKHYANIKFRMSNAIHCSCGAVRLPHNACNACGMYRGMQVLYKPAENK